MLQFFRTAFYWHWILSMIIIYLIIVIKIPVKELRAKSHWYYTILGGVTCFFTILPAIFKKYGAQRRKCYLTGAPEWKFVLGYSHLVLGIIVFVLLAFPIFRTVHRIKNDTFQDLMYQQFVQAVFLFLLATFTMLFLINAM